jgi:hypothetical protein
MAFSAIITLASAGTDTGPFDLYSNLNFATPFETNVSKSALLAGYTSTIVPNLTTTVRVKSNSLLCKNYVDMVIDDPTVTVYLKCGTEEYYYIETGTLNSARATDAGAVLCYDRQESGLLSVIIASGLYPGLTYNGTLVYSTCPCV